MSGSRSHFQCQLTEVRSRYRSRLGAHRATTRVSATRCCRPSGRRVSGLRTRCDEIAHGPGRSRTVSRPGGGGRADGPLSYRRGLVEPPLPLEFRRGEVPEGRADPLAVSTKSRNRASCRLGALTTASLLAKRLGGVSPQDDALQTAFATATVSKPALARYYLHANEDRIAQIPHPEWMLSRTRRR